MNGAEQAIHAVDSSDSAAPGFAMAVEAVVETGKVACIHADGYLADRNTCAPVSVIGDGCRRGCVRFVHLGSLCKRTLGILQDSCAFEVTSAQQRCVRQSERAGHLALQVNVAMGYVG